MSEAARTTPEQESRHDSPRAYFASLTDYNHMVLHGVWIDDLTDVDQVRAEIQKMLNASAEDMAEEYALHDHAGFGDWNPSEYESLDNLAKVAAGIEEHGLAFSAWVAYLGDASDEQVDSFDEAYRGQWASIEAFAEAMVDDHGFTLEDKVPEWIASYLQIDFERLGRDMAIDMYVTDDRDGGVWVFDPNV